LLLDAAKEQCPRVSLLFADGRYQGTLVEWIRKTEIVRKPNRKRGFWLPRRSLIYIAMTRLMLARLTA